MSNVSYERYCPRCGDITLTNDENKKCRFCGEQYLPTPYTLDDTFKGIGVNKKIFDEYIKDNPLFDEELYAQREGKEKILQQATLDKQRQGNKPKCPYCQSTNVKKISSLGRLISVGTLGLAGSKIGKQWHCKDCDSDF